MRYYSLTSLNYLFKKFNFRIFKTKEIPTHGGSIRVYVTKNKTFKTDNSVKQILKFEKKYLKMKTFLLFKNRVVKSKISLYALINKLNLQNKKVFGVGSPSRGATLVNYIGLNEDLLKCILEIKGSHKIGKYMPGTKIPIFEENYIYKNKPDYLLLLSWHISKSLIKIFKKKGYKGKFIIPLPKPKIIS
tara:strand:- start:686 stop:1252 length:567 start_codon:yes stop_codon:yes gene_type:complete